MTAYIVGMITGAICVITPLFYLMNLDRSRAIIVAQNPDFSIGQFESVVPGGLIYGVFIIGAIVFLLSAFMTAYTGLMRRRKQEPSAGETIASTRRQSRSTEEDSEEEDIGLPEM